MQLDEFLHKRKIKLFKKSYTIDQDGYEAMKIAKDPHHSVKHLENIFDELDRFLSRQNEILAHEIRFDVLVPSICWHDVWKSTREQSKNIFKFIFEQEYDGRGSAKLFKEYISKKALTGDFLEKIVYCIKNHSKSHFSIKQFSNIKDLEAKILRDLDELDAWSKSRFQHLVNSYRKKLLKLDPGVLKVAKWYFFNIIAKTDGKSMHFNYTKDEFEIRKKEIIEMCVNLWNNLDKYIDVNDKKIKNALRLSKNQQIANLNIRLYE